MTATLQHTTAQHTTAQHTTAQHTTVQGTALQDTTLQRTWVTVCRYADLLPERAVAALVGGRPVAVVRTHDGAVRAVDAVDPKCGAAVLHRGIVGDKAGVPTLISPMFKQAYSLLTGECVTEPGPAVAVYPVRVAGGAVDVCRGSACRGTG